VTVTSAAAAEAAPLHGALPRFKVANAIDSVGSGLFVPVSLLYFINTTSLLTVRIGLALTVASLLSIPFIPPIGSLVDRFGAKPVMQAGHILNASGFVGYLLVDSFSSVLLSAWIASLGRACFLRSYSATAIAMSRAGGRELMFGSLSALRNLGIGRWARCRSGDQHRHPLGLRRHRRERRLLISRRLC
jgi:MFS family permease